ncbi:MAG TPA: hypothetical protein VD902_17830 [Symbiobacteriaceae bacterium]|nr:hypothetical protein [Symbiobacteriaceae bacterium]
MPRRVDDEHQPKLAHTAADLGEEAYRANLADRPGRDAIQGETAGTVPQWKRPEPENSPPGQYRNKSAQEIQIGHDLKIHSNKEYRR